MTDDIVLNKKESIERCIRQIRTYYRLESDTPFELDDLVDFTNLIIAASQIGKELIVDE